MKFSTALKLGRVSNLPTIWTNTLVGLAFGAWSTSWQLSMLVCLVFSLFYIAGMYLNDAFDAEWDQQHQVNRPIPAGEVHKKTVIIFACVFLAVAFILLALLAGNRLISFLLALFLALCILVYDCKHKQWPSIAPWIMGSCRLAVYLCAASLSGAALWSWPLLLVAVSLLFYIAGITALARAEHENTTSGVLPLLLLFAPCIYAFILGYHSTHAILATLFALAWTVRAVLRARSGAQGCVGQAVAALLAGIAAIDAAFLFALQQHFTAIICLLAFVACLLLQKRIAAT